MKACIEVLICAAVCAVFATNTEAATKSSTPLSGATRMADEKSTFTYDRGCIIRGPRDRKRIALMFTGGSFADGGTTILNELRGRKIKASFFFTGDFFRIPEFKDLINRIRDEGHYLGPHSDRHPLYASWEDPPKLLISRKEFDDDVTSNLETLRSFGVPPDKCRYFIPPYEHFTTDIVHWTSERGMTLINYSPGARSHADYMEDNDPHFATAEEMVQTVLKKEQTDPDGLNGFLLLMHIGAGPGRTRDHLYNKLGELLDTLISRGYSFVRVDEMLGRK